MRLSFVERHWNMQWNYAVITGFLGALQDRFVGYHPQKAIEEKLALAGSINGCSGVELVFPADFENPKALPALLERHGLGVAAVNLNVKSDPLWRRGSFSAEDASVRRQAAQQLRQVMDHAAALDCNLVTSAFLNDGADYPFEINHREAFEWTVDGVREGASHRSDVRVALEYKASEPCAHCLINNAGKAATIALTTGLDNVGVNVDIGHALQAGEVPADSIAFLAGLNRLFYVHLNDNYRNWDWDLVPGTVNFLDYIETIRTLDQVGYAGWLTADVFPQRNDPVRIMESAFAWMETLIARAQRLDEETIAEFRKKGDSGGLLDYLRSRV